MKIPGERCATALTDLFAPLRRSEAPQDVAAGSAAVPRLRAFFAGESGNALMEAAFTFPLLLLLVTGLTWFGLAMKNYLVLTNAVTAGAEQVAVSRGQTTDPCALAVTTVDAAASGLTTSSLSFTLSLNGTSFGPSSGSSFSCGTSSDLTAFQNSDGGTPAVLTVTYPVNIPLYGWGATHQVTLSATMSEIIQ